MAGVKIGLDFGTHYTKICVEHSADKRNKRYQFHRFYDQNGDPHYVFPSVVQLNWDNTLSYGYVNPEDAMEVEGLPEKNPPQKPSEPKYRSYKEFPEIVKPEREQFFHDDEEFGEDEVGEKEQLLSVQTECISLFNALFKQQTWEDVKPAYVKAVIKSFALADISSAVNENGEKDIRALVDMAVLRSHTQGRDLFVASPIGMASIQTQCVNLFKTLYKQHTWGNVIPAYVIAVINNFTMSDVDSVALDNGDTDINALVNLAVLRSYTQGRELFIYSPTRSSRKKGGKRRPGYSDMKRDVIRQTQESEKRRARASQRMFEQAQAEYKKKCAQRERDMAQDKKEVDAYNNGLREEYEHRLKLWREYVQRKDEPVPMVYRSFKQMVFSEGYDWRFEEDPMMVSVWYLCYVFFDLDIEYGTQNLTVCMGTSSGRDNWERNKEKASQIILTVYDLIENVFNHDRGRFLSSTLDELKSVTNIKPFSQAAKELNQIFVFPEAYVNLNPLAKQKRFGAGINAVVDIGGGTTDISIFIVGKKEEEEKEKASMPIGANTIQKKEKDEKSKEDEVMIFDYVSIPYGVNAIERAGRDVHYHAVESEMNCFTKRIISHAHSVGVRQNEAARIVSKRPIVFAGGGSMKPELRRWYQGFTDVIHIDSTSLDGYSIDDITELAGRIPLLTTSLGLALCGTNDSAIPLIDYKTLFENVEEAYKEMLENSEFKYEHGLTDL